MADDTQKGSALDAGSPKPGPEAGAATGESGNNNASGYIDPSAYVPKSQYEELETLMGKQGVELGEYREFFNKVTPLLDKLESQPDLIQAILEDKINDGLITSVLKGDVSLKAAKEVTKAHEEVKKDLGKDKYEGMTPEQIEQMVASKIEEHNSSFERKLLEKEELKDFESKTSSFIENTPDFPELADSIAQWFENHPEQDDIRVAYDAVKGQKLAADIDKQKDIDEAEAAKAVAGNAGGGQSSQGGTIDDRNVIDELIAKRANPNLL